MLDSKTIAEILSVSEKEVRDAAKAMLIIGPKYQFHQAARIRRYLLGK